LEGEEGDIVHDGHWGLEWAMYLWYRFCGAAVPGQGGLLEWTNVCKIGKVIRDPLKWNHLAVRAPSGW
jgi:hypothetical protein